ncbi:sulfonate ABC transporter substrate-binding protein [Peribacillus muralis]|uniref:Sulfonate ABC transporter substrate-binding protein n=1 Tax=Peribacillus muralis TaxID=264697 RepID=A0A1B3XK08_9BACI|nr:cytosine permease [Peribacillus muralis]AOH53536.1 sulfonate ABC transporter substrate-binding protein [Peribacillus muralis]
MKVEERSIEYIPANERHGKAKDLFPIWFGANMNITTLVSGSLPIVLGLNLFWSVTAIILGSLIGAIFMASHSVQGPKLGIPQMIQSRAQFGVIGAIIPLFLVMFIYLGFFASNTLLAAQTIANIFPINQSWNIMIIGAICFVVALYGYDLIHKVQKWFSAASLFLFLIMTFIVFQLPVPAGQWVPDDFALSGFFLSVSIAVTWQLSYAPYVADYSRYLPVHTPPAKTFWYSYTGTVIGAVWMMVLGAVLTVAIPGFLDNTGGNLAHLFGNFAILMFVLIVFGQLAINVFNLYGAFMSSVTTIEPFFKFRVTPKVRMGFLLCITIIATTLCIVGQGNFLEFFMNFIFFMSYFLIPWTSINLVDYYILRQGEYSVKDIFDVNGKYGKINWIATIAFVASIVAEIPFINTSFYVGPAARALHGADLAWAMGLFLPAVLYYFPMKRRIRKDMFPSGVDSVPVEHDEFLS